MAGREPSGSEDLNVETIRTAARSVSQDNIGPYNPDQHGKPNRVKVLDSPELKTSLIFKGCRNSDLGILDMFCDRLYAQLGLAYMVPTPIQAPIQHGELGLGVVSPLVEGEQGIQVERDDFDNAEKIPILVTFEEWILNHDDKESHFWTVQGDRKEIQIVDHGHADPRNPHFRSPEEALESGKLKKPASNNNHFYTSADQVQSGIEVIKSAEDGEIRSTIDLVIEEFRQIDGNAEGLDAFLENIEGYGKAAEETLKRRRENIESIMSQKYKS